ncbi:MAG: hypothetical protein AB7G17_00055 [Phycisphaerales bacterium]
MPNVAHSDIPGVSRSTLWKAWKSVRKDLKKSSIRDAIDHLEYDINPDKWIKQILTELRGGRYDPHSPRRFTEAKSMGLSRVMTEPEIPDLVLYRAIVDHAYQRGRRLEGPHVYCERAEKNTTTSNGKDTSTFSSDDDSGSQSVQSYRAWMLFNQHRKFLVLDQEHKYFVLMDISNYFDSILHDRIVSSIMQLGLNHRTVGLLMFILERLSVRDSYSDSPRIGLPVDEFACSRKLAHMVLYPHDERMTEAFGVNAYTRWMDDQIYGVATREDGLKCIAAADRSLRRLHLTPNTRKTRILSLEEASRHFHFDHNADLDAADELAKQEPRPIGKLKEEVDRIYNAAIQHEYVGQWDKVLKRIYRLAALANSSVLRDRVLQDILSYPLMASRIVDYVRVSRTPKAYLKFAEDVWSNRAQVYPDVAASVYAGLLRAEPVREDSRRIAKIAVEILREGWPHVGADRCAGISPLLVLRFGDKRNLPTLLASCRQRTPESRAAAAVICGFGIEQFHEVRKIASRSMRNPLATLVLMIDEIRKYREVPQRWSLRCKPVFDPMTRKNYVDMRGLVAIRLLGLNGQKAVRAWLKESRSRLLRTPISEFDMQMIHRLWPNC